MCFKYLTRIGRSGVALLITVASWSSPRKRKLRGWIMVPSIVTSRVTLKCSTTRHAMASTVMSRGTNLFLRHYQLSWTLSFVQMFMCQRLTSKFMTKTSIRRKRLIKILIQPGQCCYGSHCGMANGTNYHMCGWDAIFSDMLKHEQVKTDEYTGKEATHAVRACLE